MLVSLKYPQLLWSFVYVYETYTANSILKKVDSSCFENEIHSKCNWWKMKNKKRWFQKLFYQCVLTRQSYLSQQVGNGTKIKANLDFFWFKSFFLYGFIYFLFSSRQELRKQCTDLQQVQLRNKSEQVRSISCQFPSNPTVEWFFFCHFLYSFFFSSSSLE